MIRIEMEHSLSTDALLAGVIKMIDLINDTIPIKAEWDSDTYRQIKFEATGGLGKGTKGSLLLETSRVVLEAELPLALRPMEATIRKDIEDSMTEAIHGT